MLSQAACLPALPCLALPCLALPCLALPCLALPCLALPCLALPCLALPCLALPCLALPCLALPCPACRELRLRNSWFLSYFQSSANLVQLSLPTWSNSPCLAVTSTPNLLVNYRFPLPPPLKRKKEQNNNLETNPCGFLLFLLCLNSGRCEEVAKTPHFEALLSVTISHPNLVQTFKRLGMSHAVGRFASVWLCNEEEKAV